MTQGMAGNPNWLTSNWISNQLSNISQTSSYASMIGQSAYGEYMGSPPSGGMGMPSGGGAGMMANGFGSMEMYPPGHPGRQAGREQAAMGGMAMLAGPASPFPLNQPFMQMQEQYNTNRALEQNFSFVRPGGRGFTPMQQLAVGTGFRQIAAQTPGLEVPELQGLMQQGAQLGQYQGVKDVTGMIKRTRSLLEGWRDIAIELGTTMKEAQAIQAQVRQIGVFGGWTADPSSSGNGYPGCHLRHRNKSADDDGEYGRSGSP